VFEAPSAPADLERDCVSAQLEHRYLHRRSSAQRRIEEDERDTPARERLLWRGARFEPLSQINQRGQLLAVEVGSAQEISTAQVHLFFLAGSSNIADHATIRKMITSFLRDLRAVLLKPVSQSGWVL